MSRWWVRLTKLLTAELRGVAAIVVVLVLIAATGALQPWPIKLLIDHALPEEPFPEWLGWIPRLPGGGSTWGVACWLTSATVLFFLLSWGLGLLQAYLHATVGERVTYRLAARLFEHLQRVSMRFHVRRPTGDLVRRVSQDSRSAEELILGVASPLVSAAATLSVMFLLMWQLDPATAMLSTTVMVPIGIAQRRFYSAMTETASEQYRLEAMLQSQAEQTLSALPVVQSFRREADEERRYRGLAGETLRAYFRGLTAQLKLRIGINLATTFGHTAVLAFGAYRITTGELTVGGLVVVISYVWSFYGPLAELSVISSAIARAEAGAKRVFEILDAEAPHATGAAPPGGLPETWQGGLSLERVRFGYDRERPVLAGLSLDIRPGEHVTVAGPTGCGKSTLASLLVRFFDPDSGVIRLDGIDYRKIPLSVLREQIGILLQDPFVLPVSVAENISYGRPGASQDEIERAARAAQADAFIRELPDGYRTRLGERGADLSGGQRQRIAIARLLLKNPTVLILDEPTSALDTRSEQRLAEAMRSLCEGRTTITIAHRQGSIHGASRVVRLDHASTDPSPDDLERTPQQFG